MTATATANRFMTDRHGRISREELVIMAAAIKSGNRPHRCIDRDWCNTTGETGCGTADTMLAELRDAWRTAPHADRVGYHAAAYDANGRAVSDGFGMDMYGDYPTLEAAREGAERMFARGKTVDRVAIRYSFRRVAGQPWNAGAGIEGIARPAHHGEAAMPRR